MEFEEALEDHIGPFGPWQKLAAFTLAISILPATPMLMSMVHFTPLSKLKTGVIFFLIMLQELNLTIRREKVWTKQIFPLLLHFLSGALFGH